MHFFTADQHYGHANIIRFCNRPFADVDEMDRELIRRHNEVVGPEDTVIHVGDLAFRGARSHTSYLAELNGHHVLVRGNHDRGFPADVPHLRKVVIEGRHIVACHYAMRVWPHSHHGSWQVYGHSHGTLPPLPGQWDVGVDNNDFAPVSFDRLCEVIASGGSADHHQPPPHGTGPACRRTR